MPKPDTCGLSEAAELKPCPFCGGTSAEIRPNGIGDFFVICHSDEASDRSCGASTSERHCETVAGAISRWNTRSEPARPATGAVERVAEAIWNFQAAPALSSPAREEVEGVLSRGHQHTAIMEAIREGLILQHADAFVEDSEGGLVIPSGCTPQTAFVKIDVSTLADAVLSLFPSQGGRDE